MNSSVSTKYRKHLQQGGVPAEQALAHADALSSPSSAMCRTEPASVTMP
jgi:hypothetical protein